MTENSSKEFLLSPWENCWLSQYLLHAQSHGYSRQLYFFEDVPVQAVLKGHIRFFSLLRLLTLASSVNVFHENC